MSSFTKKRIDVTFTLANSVFEGTQSNTLKLSGLRVRMLNTVAGGVSKDKGQIAIYGLSVSHMNQLSTYGMPVGVNLNNQIMLEAGDDENGMAAVFSGAIWDAFGDYTAAPDVFFSVSAYSLLYEAVQTAPVISIKGGVSAATIMGNLAQQLGLKLENSGVSVILTSPHFSGSAIDQVYACATAGNFNAYPDVIRGSLAIWPRNGSRSVGDSDPLLVSPNTILVGYPTYSNFWLDFKALYSPNLIFGRTVQIQSSIKPSCGMWTPQTIMHDLASEEPGGPWFSYVRATQAPAQ